MQYTYTRTRLRETILSNHYTIYRLDDTLIRCCINFDFITDYLTCANELQASFAKSIISEKKQNIKIGLKKSKRRIDELSQRLN